jgi:hypothetical protein
VAALFEDTDTPRSGPPRLIVQYRALNVAISGSHCDGAKESGIKKSGGPAPRIL